MVFVRHRTFLGKIWYKVFSTQTLPLIRREYLCLIVSFPFSFLRRSHRRLYYNYFYILLIKIFRIISSSPISFILLHSLILCHNLYLVGTVLIEIESFSEIKYKVSHETVVILQNILFVYFVYFWRRLVYSCVCERR